MSGRSKPWNLRRFMEKFVHPNPIFRQSTRAENLAFAAARGFGQLMLNGPEGPLVAHVPFLVDAGAGFVDLHLARSNPIARADLPQAAVLSVSGADAYISPDWYGMADQVPTWNYVAVQVRGRLTALPQADLRAMLDELSARFEADLAPKAPWLAAKMSDGALEKMMRAIQPFRLMIAAVDGTWKLGQNKPLAARMSVVTALDAQSGARDALTIATLMRDPPKL